MSHDWATYYTRTVERPPRELLVRAAKLAPTGRALDLGCGAGADADYLAGLGYAVTGVDRHAAAAPYVSARRNRTIRFVQSPLESFEFGRYELITSLFVLPFLPRSDFELVMSRCGDSLVPGGILVVNAFGLRDDWADSKAMTFLTQEELAALAGDLDVLELSEEEYDGTTADGAAKHWDIHNLIARSQG